MAETGYDLIQKYSSTFDTRRCIPNVDEKARVLLRGKGAQLEGARFKLRQDPVGHSARIARMISETASMMFLTTNTETEGASSGTKSHQTGSSHITMCYCVMINPSQIFWSQAHMLSPDQKTPRCQKGKRRLLWSLCQCRGSEQNPLTAATGLYVAQLFDSMFDSRSRPCLQYQIKRCSGPCVGKISERDYAAFVKDAERFLSGKSTEIQEKLANDMAQAAEGMEFERAAAIRDRIRALTQVQTTQGINPRTVSEADIVALHLDLGQACVQVFFIRAHQNWGNRDFYPRVSGDMTHEEGSKLFLDNFTQLKSPHAKLFCPMTSKMQI